MTTANVPKSSITPEYCIFFGISFRTARFSCNFHNTRKCKKLANNYLPVAPCTEQHGHMSKHADCGERDWGNALCVQHVRIVPAIWVPEDVSCLCVVASVRRQSRNHYKMYTTSFPLRCIFVP